MKLTITLDETTQDTEIATDPPMSREELVALLFDLALSLDDMTETACFGQVEAARTWH